MLLGHFAWLDQISKICTDCRHFGDNHHFGGTNNASLTLLISIVGCHWPGRVFYYWFLSFAGYKAQRNYRCNCRRNHRRCQRRVA